MEWKEEALECAACGACSLRRITRGEARSDRFPEYLSVRVIPRGPLALS